MTKKFPTKQVLIGSLLSVLFLGVLAVGANYSIIDRITDRAGDYLGREVLKMGLADQITIEEPEELGGTIMEDWVRIGKRVTWVKSGEFADATTTIFSFLNPINATATSTVTSVNLDITGAATSSMVMVCGGASDQYSSPTYELFNLTIPTSTIGVFNNNQATTTDGQGVIGTGSATQILLTHDYNYFNCVAKNVGDADDLTGITGDSNTFEGTWSVEVVKNLK